jgi:biotin carboxylase
LTERRPAVLVIGTDRYALEACVRRDLDAVVVVGAAHWDDGLIEVPATLRVLRVDNHLDPEHIVTALHRGGLGDVTWDAVHTGDENALVAAALLAGYLGCPTIGATTAAHFRDKSVQKRAVAAAGLRTARTTLVEDVYDVSGIAELPYPRAVLKPVAGAATERTVALSSVEQLRAVSREFAAARIPERTFLLEEFSPGDEWVVDGVVFEGEVVFCSVARYGVPCLTTVTESLPLSLRRFDPDADAWAFDAAVPFATAALESLGLRRGVFHMELFHDPASGELIFGECAARRGGALTHEEVQAKFGVHLGDCAVLCSLDRRPEIDAKVRPDVIGGGYLMGHPGVLVRCPTAAELRELPGVEFARIEKPYGVRVDGALAGTDQRLGQVLIGADGVDQHAERLAAVRAWFAERVVTVPEGATTRELRAWQRATSPRDDLRDTLWH